MKNIALIIASVFLSANLSAQENYYTNQATGRYSTFDEHGVEHAYIYKYDPEMEEVKIYNVANRFVDIEPLYKDGTLVTGAVSIGRISSYDNNPQRIHTVNKIIYNELSPEQKLLIRGNELIVRMLVDTETGKVGEVEFYFDSDKPFSLLPIDFYSRVEQSLKKSPDVVFKLTDVGRSRNYIPVNWYHEPMPEDKFSY